MNLLHAVLSIPVLPMARRHGWWSNRRAHDAWWLSPRDVALNVSDSWHGFTNRLPQVSWMHRDQQNGYAGSAYQVEQRNQNNDPFGS